MFDDKQVHLYGLHRLTDEIGRLVQSVAGVDTLISPLVASQLSSLTVVSECLHQLYLFKLWSRKIEDDMEINNNALTKAYQAAFKDWSPFLAIKFEGSQVYKYADPTDAKFGYPVHRRHNKQNTAILREAEANLDASWNAVDQHYKSKGIAKSQHDLVAHLLRSDRAIQRTSEWIERGRSKSAITEEREHAYKPFSTVFHDATKQVTGTFDRASLSDKAPKVKARGTAAPTSDEEPQPGIAHESNEVASTFDVDKRAHKVFRSLFHSPNNPDTPGEIPWPDFFHAMVSIGFSAEKLHGSAWSFTPQTLDVSLDRSIQFHEPHPSNKIPFFMAGRHGRRLARAYG